MRLDYLIIGACGFLAGLATTKQGPPGPRGPAGPMGPQGPAGERGLNASEQRDPFAGSRPFSYHYPAQPGDPDQLPPWDGKP